jgi:hypothetical protein
VTHFKTLSILLLILPLSACSNVYRRGIHQVGNWGPVTLIEDGQIKSLYTRQLKEYRGPKLYYMSSRSKWSSILTEKPTTWNNDGYDDSDSVALWNHAPEWRREEKLTAAAKRLTSDFPPELQRYIISSHNPLVIALTEPDPNPIKGIDGFFGILNPYSQLTEHLKMDTLVISQQWPIFDDPLLLPPERKILDLHPRLTIRELQQLRPWEKNDKPTFTNTPAN